MPTTTSGLRRIPSGAYRSALPLVPLRDGVGSRAIGEQ